jgi:glycosyltransferase involved in cell wall biosynthesis
LKKIPYKNKIKARIIFPKIHKSFFFRFLITLFGLENCVEILPKQADMESFYKSIDCYILPSLNEAFGLVVTEAAANFRPSLVSSTTGVRELIFNGENGFVFDRSHHPSKNLAHKIEEVSQIYFNEHERYLKICQNAQNTAKQLQWKDFTDSIINNMIEEKTGSLK